MKIKKILVILAVVLLGVSLAACQNESRDKTKEQYSSSSSAKFVYYTMPSVLEASDHLYESTTNGISGIAVDPETRCEYYFSGIHAANSYRSTPNLIIKPRYDSHRKIVKYNGELSALHQFRFR